MQTNSDKVPVLSTRRRFLSQAATVAASGTALALATIQPASTAAATGAALASSGPDPIFAAIATYRAALQARAVAQEEHGRRRAMVREELGQSDPCICIQDMSKDPAFRSSVMQQAYSIEQIDKLCPRDKYPDLNKLHRQLFRKLAGKHKTLMGDVDRVLDDTYQPLLDSSDALVETVPTSMAGIFGMLQFQRELYDTNTMDFTHDQMGTLLFSIEKGIKANHGGET